MSSTAMDVRVSIRSKTDTAPQEIVVSGRDQFTLGRGPSSAALLDGPGISREHVAVSIDQSQIFVTDLSVNGAWINGKRLPQKQKHPVGDGDVIELPGYEITFQPERAPTALPPSESESTTETHHAPPKADAEISPNPVRAFLSNFTLLDRILILLALLSLSLLTLYILD